MRRIRATFIGEDNSLGYVHKYTYNLIIVYIEEAAITIRREDTSQQVVHNGVCEYSNIFAFLDNWSNISSISDN